MSRDERGRFMPGYCGNPKGRTPKQPMEISPEQMRIDFFLTSRMPVWLVENGKRKKIPAHVAIDRQLIKKAVEGEKWAILEYKRLEYKHTKEFFDEQVSLMETLVETERQCREAPEEVTEKLLEIMRRARALLAPAFRP